MHRAFFGPLTVAIALAACPTSPLAAAPMDFTLLTEGPPAACAAICRQLISASGVITADTPRAFQAFVRDNLPQTPPQAGDAGVTVMLESDGGSVLGAIELGRAIRRLGFSTMVGRVIERQPKGVAKFGEIVTRVDCQSMCTFVLLGGVQRRVPPDARVFVHQIWLGDRREDAVAASYSAEDLVVVQRDIGSIVQYAMEMGGNAELVALSLKSPPWEPTRMLTREELRRTGLDMAEPAAPITPMPTSVAVNSTAGLALAAGDLLPPAPEEGRGWLAVTRAGQPAVGRTHPLTVEGELIGSFDLFVACGPTPQTYTLTYSEKRVGPAEQGLPPKISQVAVAIDGELKPLKISSSEKVPRGELYSVASAVLPARLVRWLAADGPASMTLKTDSAGNPRTVIRVGNAGFGSNFRDLDKSCSEPSRVGNVARAQAGTGPAEPINSPAP